MKTYHFSRLNQLTFFILLIGGGLFSCSSDDSVISTIAEPTITGFSPSSGEVGGIVTISGTNFSATTSKNIVKFNGVAAVVNSASATSLSAIVPIDATTGKISVTVDGQTVTSADDFTVIGASASGPSITGFSPASGEFGTTVTITGTNFSTITSENKVKFNDMEATVSSASPTSLTVTVPDGATTGKISITVNEQTTISVADFTVTSVAITSLSITEGEIGASVIIYGANFGTDAADLTIDFNGATSTINDLTNTSITTTVPDNAMTGDVTISKGGRTIRGPVFTVTYEEDPNTVYVVGTGTLLGIRAIYWKNGVPVDFGNESYTNVANTITVDGEDVYITGSEVRNKYEYPMCWKNGEEVFLSLAVSGADVSVGSDSKATHVTVVGSDVYVSGYEPKTSTNTAHRIAKYWKNGSRITLTDGTVHAQAHCIAVVNNDVYVGGQNEFKAAYWKNGAMTVLEEAFSSVNDIVVVGNDVYVAGQDNQQRAVYWKNGTAIGLSGGIVAYAIEVSGNDVYVVGYGTDSESGNVVAKYWKNGTPVNLTDGSRPAFASDIAIVEDDIYISGSSTNNNGEEIAKYWKNGKPLNLGKNLNARSIAVIKP
ncbi:IPT/TIG domain-containing protein [Fulvivirga ulvae]|uniref:IPT/TIG domain-containing protein n=1 Tax=Fulvivirga ulvae TaxID=2904245 RepID=UPI001F2F4AD2|nr:IPT/TIG domain-containing protein [Fulvivirga ulvae]UII33181.1 IPT/TIG domain-containing protein [Fulvivirga ulvae]